MWLLEEIVSSFESGNEFDHLFSPESPFVQCRPRGIPIGNLTSQLFINIVLNELDQYAKHTLKIRYYIRYVDDFVVLHHDKKYLHLIKNQIEFFLREKLFLELHPKKQRIFPVDQGIDFLGFVIWKNHRLLRKSNKEKFRKKLKRMRRNLLKKTENEEKMRQKVTSWLAHCQFGDTFRLRKRMFGLRLEAKDQDILKALISHSKDLCRQKAYASSVQLGLFDTLEKQKPDER